MAIREKLENDVLEMVAGGVTYDNSEGDHSVYKIGKNGGPFTHTFLKTDKPRLLEIIASVHDASIPVADDEENIMQALLAEPGLLTPID